MHVSRVKQEPWNCQQLGSGNKRKKYHPVKEKMRKWNRIKSKHWQYVSHLAIGFVFCFAPLCATQTIEKSLAKACTNYQTYKAQNNNTRWKTEQRRCRIEYMRLGDRPGVITIATEYQIAFSLSHCLNVSNLFGKLLNGFIRCITHNNSSISITNTTTAITTATTTRQQNKKSNCQNGMSVVIFIYCSIKWLNIKDFSRRPKGTKLKYCLNDTDS